MRTIHLILAAALSAAGLAASGKAQAGKPAEGRAAASSRASSGEAARAGLEAQIAAWNRHDLEAALDTYWDSPRMTWISRSGVQHGLTEFADSMKTEFADPARMGSYKADILDVRDLGAGTGMIVFRWEISRDGKRLMGGVSTQLWRQVDDGWKVVFEHAS